MVEDLTDYDYNAAWSYKYDSLEDGLSEFQAFGEHATSRAAWAHEGMAHMDFLSGLVRQPWRKCGLRRLPAAWGISAGVRSRVLRTRESLARACGSEYCMCCAPSIRRALIPLCIA